MPLDIPHLFDGSTWRKWRSLSLHCAFDSLFGISVFLFLAFLPPTNENTLPGTPGLANVFARSSYKTKESSSPDNIDALNNKINPSESANIFFTSSDISSENISGLKNKII